jgi:hypothetical protein
MKLMIGLLLMGLALIGALKLVLIVSRPYVFPDEPEPDPGETQTTPEIRSDKGTARL